MDKTMVGLLGAVGGALVAAIPAQAAPAPHAVLEAASYADLLRPVPNALATLKALDASEARVQDAQYYPYYYPPPPPYYWRHHHHHGYYQRYYHHHHHHHHRYYHHGYDR